MIDGAIENPKIVVYAIINLNIPFDRVRQVALGTLIGTVGTNS